MSQGVPYSSTVEADLLGIAMLYADVADQIAHDLHPDDFYVPVHRGIFTAITSLRLKGAHTDPLTVHTQLRAQGLNAIEPHELLGMLSNSSSRGSVPHRIRDITEMATRRRLLLGISDLAGMASNPQIGLTQLADQADAILKAVTVPVSAVEPAPNLAEFLAVDDEPYEWVVPGLLERRDRLILTGGEGMGKSTFLRQFALMCAYGCHPFTERYLPKPVKVLLVDVENSERQLRRSLRPLDVSLTQMGYKFDPDNFRIRVREEPIDLRTPADARWLYEEVAAAQPDMVVIGPLYKIGAVGNDEEPAKQVQKVLDTIRARWSPCLLMETHSPHGESAATRRPLRPIGASIWMRWPEFGYGIERDRENELETWWSPWRGPRERREWPRKLRQDHKLSWRFLE